MSFDLGTLSSWAPAIGSAIGAYYGNGTSMGSTGGALIGGTLGSGIAGSQASKEASQAQVGSINQALALNAAEYAQTRNDLSPYRQAGSSALNRMMLMMGLPGIAGGSGSSGTSPSDKTQGGPANLPASYGGTTLSGGVGGSPAYGTAGAGNPGAMTSTGMGTAINSGAGGNFGYNGGDYSGGYGPSTITTGGNTITGDSGGGGTNWEGIAGGVLGAALLGPMGAILGSKLGGGDNGQFTTAGIAGYQGPDKTFNGAKIDPTKVILPTTTTHTPGQIINPATGGAYGQAYYSTPVGAQAAFHNALALGNAQSSLENNIANSAAHQVRREHGGPVHAPIGQTQDVLVGEKGPELLRLAPGSHGYVVPNSPAVERLAGKIPGRFMGGPVGLEPRIGAMTPMSTLRQQAPVGTPIPPMHNAMGGAGSQPTMPYRPPGMQNTMGYSTTTGPAGTSAVTSSINPSSGGGSSAFNPFGSNTTATMSNGQTPADILSSSPQYQFAMQQGIQGLDNSAAANGGLLSGGHTAAILNYSQGLASQQYQNIWNNLMGVTSAGESAAGMGGQYGMYNGMTNANLYSNMGNAQANGITGGYNNMQNMFGNLAFLYGMNGYGGSNNTGTSNSGTGGHT